MEYNSVTVEHLGYLKLCKISYITTIILILRYLNPCLIISLGQIPMSIAAKSIKN